MQLKTLITTIILGTSSIAAASPAAGIYVSGGLTVSGGIYTTPIVRDHRSTRPLPAPQPAPAPIVRDHRHTPPMPAPLPAPQPAPQPQPIVIVQPQPSPQPILIGHYGYTRPALTWMTLASSVDLEGRAFIRVAPTTRAFTKLHLRATGKGRTKLDKVMIEYANGKNQLVTLNTVLNNGHKSLTIDLNGGARSIMRIVLIGKSNKRSSLEVLAI